MKKNQNYGTLRKYAILLFLLFLFISISAFSYVSAVSSNIADSVFRLHIIANSNSIADQNLKLLVRDKVIEYMNSISKGYTTKSDVINLVENNLENFKQITQNVIHENGYDYNVTISVGNFEFPTKAYGDISLPAGAYDALKIEIGNANGQNWWCVMFPPLCFVDVSSGIVPDDSKKIIQDKLSDEEFYIISENTPDVKFKFKLIELLSNMANTFTAKKANF